MNDENCDWWCGSTEHRYTQRRAGRIILVLCSCGASKQFRVENALARAAKVRRWQRIHESPLTTIEGKKHERECPCPLCKASA